MNKIFFNLLGLTVSFFAFLFMANPSLAHDSGPAYPYSLQVMPGQVAGTVDLKWLDDSTANRYDLTYGTDASANMWGVQNINENPNSWTMFTVRGLNPGTTYYFMMVAKNGDQYVAKTGPVSTMAKSGMAKAAPVAVAPVKPAQAADQSLNMGPTSRYSFQVMTGQKSGSVDLKWKDDESANQYDLVYGLEQGKYLWGVQDIKESMNMNQSFTVMGLQPGVKYYFSLVAENGGSFYLQAGPLTVTSK